MSDFYALLKQSIIDRGIANAKDRAEIYAQARQAVIKQLWAYLPPLAADEIDQRVGAYDTAVERIEAELIVAFASGTVPPPVRRKAPVPPPPPPLKPIPPKPKADENLREEPDAPAFAFAGDDVEEHAMPRALAPYVPPPPRPIRPRDTTPVHDEEAARRDAYDERWSEPMPGARVRGGGLGWLGTGEQRTVRLLSIAVGVLVVLFIGVVAFLLGSRGREGVTLPIGVRQEVSDAATASRIATDAVDLIQSFSVFNGQDPTVFDTSPDNPIRFDSSGGFARVASAASASGVKVLVGPGLASRLAGQTVRVVIEARSSVDRGAAGMRFAYQSGVAISHWQTANLDSDFALVGLTWRLPAMRTNPAGDYIIIEPGIPGDGTGADIKSIRVDIVRP